MTRHAWVNFVTGTLDERTPPETDAEACAYIPQDGATQARYRALRDAGDTPVTAIRAIVSAALDTWHPPPPCPRCYPQSCHCWRTSDAVPPAA